MNGNLYKNIQINGNMRFRDLDNYFNYNVSNNSSVDPINNNLEQRNTSYMKEVSNSTLSRRSKTAIAA